ncbi:MAG: hypothetical protein EB084_24690, partial [Proteobacteria bacterium]|nr:hypothetical protein [Pseudomonadota bacterium]
MFERLCELVKLDVSVLLGEVKRRGRQFGASRWELAVCLLAVERRGVHLERGCSSVVTFAVRELKLDPQPAYEMLRVARALEHLPALSQGLRDGDIPWTSIRELTRNATPEEDMRLA